MGARGANLVDDRFWNFTAPARLPPLDVIRHENASFAKDYVGARPSNKQKMCKATFCLSDGWTHSSIVTR